jgi:chemotaxis protein CheC
VAGYSNLQLDALREMANVGSGMAGTALSHLVGRSVDISVPKAMAIPAAEAVEAIGDPEATVTAVMLGIAGELEGIVAMLFAHADEAALCGLLGVETGGELGHSAMCEIGNILGASYLGALTAMSGMVLEPTPPQMVTDMLGAIVASALVPTVGSLDAALLLDSSLHIEGVACSCSFLLLPTAASAGELLARLGVPA